MKSWNEIRKAATAFSKRWKNAYDEKSQAQSFLKEFFAVFGVDAVTVATFEHRVKFADGSQGYADCLWQGKILVEMKSRSKDLDAAFQQAMEYVRNLGNVTNVKMLPITNANSQLGTGNIGSTGNISQLPRAIVVSDFARVRFYDLAHDAVLTEFALKDFRKFADTPALFREQNNPKTAIIIPKVSSEKRDYIPIGFINDSVIVTDLAFLIPNATLYHFGILSSRMHMAWMRAVAGRLKSDYRYSKDIVYNNFPWPEVENECGRETIDERRERETRDIETSRLAPHVSSARLMPNVSCPRHDATIAAAAQAVLDARAAHPTATLADLYDPLTMPPDLVKAHAHLDALVDKAYGLSPSCTDLGRVAHLFKLYAEKAKEM